MIIIKDANGNYIPIKEQDLMEVITDGTIYGMPMNCICEFRYLYLEHGGKIPITIESVREIFKYKPYVKP